MSKAEEGEEAELAPRKQITRAFAYIWPVFEPVKVVSKNLWKKCDFFRESATSDVTADALGNPDELKSV
jgi:hypothetical protein